MTTVTAKRLYGTSAGVTFSGLASMVSSSTRLAGATSAAVDISGLTDPGQAPSQHMIGGAIKTGTGSLTASMVEIFIAASEDGTSYAGGLSASGTPTLTAEQKALLKLLWRFATHTTVSTVYQLTPVEISAKFGGALPRKYLLFVTHSTGQNLASSGSAFSFTSQTHKSE